MLAASIRSLAMILLLLAGNLLLRPPTIEIPDLGLAFKDVALAAGTANRHTPCRMADDFANILPWLSSVGAAVAAADFDGDGWTDFYVTNSGRDSANRLFRNLGDGTFTDVAGEAGVADCNDDGATMDAVFFDLDNDGDQDLFVARYAASCLLFENLGDGVFRDMTARAGVGFWGYPNAVVVFDHDRDGLLDIYLANYFPNRIQHPETGDLVRNDLWHPVTTRVLHDTFTNAVNGGRNVLYRNLGGGRFQDVTAQAGLEHTGWSLDAGFGDLNNDGWPDLYVANDYGKDELYFNQGASGHGVSFERSGDPGGHPGIGHDWWKGMNVDMADVDGNGVLDIYVANILVPNQLVEGNMLWMGYPDAEAAGGHRYLNLSAETGTQDGGWGWGARFGDFNNDGLIDLFAANGFVQGADPGRNYWFGLQELSAQHKDNIADARHWLDMADLDLAGHQTNRLFMQLADGKKNDERGKRQVPRFVDMAAACGITGMQLGRGVGLADYDRDGDVDIFLSNQDTLATLYQNQLISDQGTTGPREDAHWLSLKLIGDPDSPRWDSGLRLASSRDAVGARVESWVAGERRIQELATSNGFSSQSESLVHLGLGSSTVVEKLVIHWPSGRSETVGGPALALDRLHVFHEGRVEADLSRTQD